MGAQADAGMQTDAGDNVDAGNAPAANEDASFSPSDAGQADAMTADSGSVFNGHTYALTSSTQDWPASQSACASLGMHLVQIDDMAEQTFVRNLSGAVDAWIGATDIEQEGVWHWSFGGPQFWSGNHNTGFAVNGRFVYWNPGTEPNNAGAAEHCAIVYTATNGHWSDLPCSLPYSAICESY